MSTTEEKLDAVLKSLDSLKEEHKDGQQDLRRRIEKLEKDVTSGQEEATQRVVKRLKEDRTLVFRKKGNEKQFLFNDNVKDQFDAAGKHLDLLEPSGSGQKETLEKAKEELHKGLLLLAGRQKRIKMADRSEYGWAVVDEYEDDELASDEDDAKKIEKAEKSVASKAVKRRKTVQPRTAPAGRYNRQPRALEPAPARDPREHYRNQTNVPRPQLPAIRPPRLPGACWQCGEMGHLRVACPKSNKPYPLNDIECVDKSAYSGESSKVEVPNVGDACTIVYEGVDDPHAELVDSQPGIKESRELELEFTRSWEFEQTGTQITDVQGYLLKNVMFWEQVIQAPFPIIECIKEGYKLPLLSLPEPYSSPNHKSALENSEFVNNAIVDLVKNRCIIEMSNRPCICSPLSVVVNSTGKKRLVIDLRYLNQHLLREKFKYEDLRLAMLMFQKGDFLFAFDLKSGYHHVDIHKSHWEYLGFAWNDGVTIKYYVFKVLPFGLATACYVFTKLLRPLIKYWRSQGLRVIIYLDDGIVAVQGKEAAEAASKKVQSDLREAGLIENSEKCSWVPVQGLMWLGFNLDLQKGIVEVPKAKIEALHSRLKDAISAKILPAKSLASITGKLISMSIALGPVTRLMTRSLYALIDTRQSWCQGLVISSEARHELQFWLDQLENFNGQNIWHSPSAIRLVYSDASSTGYGGYMIEHGWHIAHGQWLPQEANQSSTWRELRAVRKVLESLSSKLMNQRVRWFTDNQNVARILMTGSRKPVLQEEALAIFKVSISSHIRIEPEWIPREANQQADFVSRIIDNDDWSLHPNIFELLNREWGPHTIDRFASYFNTQLPRFNSRFWNPGTEAVDAFTCDWKGENNWWCPPIYLVPRVLGHALLTHAYGTLVVPQWPSAPFWPMLFAKDSKFRHAIVSTIEINKSDVVICPGRSGGGLFKGTPNTNLIAIRLDFQQG